MSVPFVYVNGNLSLVLKGKIVSVTPEHPSYGTVKAKLATATEDELIGLTNIQAAVQNFVSSCKCSKGKATVVCGQVLFNGKPVHGTLATRIVEFMKEGLPFEHLLKFMENVEQNPSNKAKEELFDFLQHKNLPITEDGCFLAYKAVRGDWYDKYSGTILNTVGAIVEVSRNTVDDDRERGCSHGLHVGALDYAGTYGGEGDRMLIVKINPRDAVSVPKDCSYQKLRCCKYEVVGEYEGDLVRPLYTNNAQPVKSNMDDESYDWSWTDEDEDYCPDCGCDLDDAGGCDCTEDNWDDDEDDDDDDYWQDKGQHDEDDDFVGDDDHCGEDGCDCQCTRSAQPRDSHGRFASNNPCRNVKQPKRDNRGRFSR